MPNKIANVNTQQKEKPKILTKPKTRAIVNKPSHAQINRKHAQKSIANFIFFTPKKRRHLNNALSI